MYAYVATLYCMKENRRIRTENRSTLLNYLSHKAAIHKATGYHSMNANNGSASYTDIGSAICCSKISLILFPGATVSQ